MMKNISILGLNTIGASLGLAMGEIKDEFVIKGYDPDPLKMRTQNLKLVIDSFHHDPASCVADAQVIFITLPSIDIEQTLLEVKDSIQPTAMIICLTPTKVATRELAKKVLGPSIQFAALQFIFPPETNINFTDPVHYATASLFEKIPAAIATANNAKKGVTDIIANLCNRLGAVPYFYDMLEMDGLISTSLLLPTLISSAFVNVTLNAPGRQELEKFAGSAYHAAASAVVFNENSKEFSHDAILQKEHVIRGLDSMISTLEDLKRSITSENEKQVERSLEIAKSSLENWLSNRNVGSLGSDSLTDQVMPEKGDFWRQQLGVFGRKPGRDIKRTKD